MNEGISYCMHASPPGGVAFTGHAHPRIMFESIASRDLKDLPQPAICEHWKCWKLGSRTQRSQCT